MQLRIPFAYSVSGVTKAGGRVENAARVESFVADIAEATLDSMPAAMFHMAGLPTKRLPHVVRVGKGGYFYRSCPWDRGKGEIRKSLSVADLREGGMGKASEQAYMDERGIVPGTTAARLISNWYRSAGDGDDAPLSEAYTEVTETDRQLRLMEAEEFAGRIVLAGDQLVFRCEEPKIVVSLQNEMGGPLVTVWSGSTDVGTTVLHKLGVRIGGPAETRIFRADDMDGVRAFLDGRGIDNAIEYAREPMCIAPQLMTFDPVSDFAERSAQKVVALVGEDNLGTLDREAMVAWLDLRERPRGMSPDAKMDRVRMLVPSIMNGQTRDRFTEIVAEWDRWMQAPQSARHPGVAP